MRILVREEGDKRFLTYRDSRALAREHGLDEENEIVGKLNGLLQSLADSVCS